MVWILFDLLHSTNEYAATIKNGEIYIERIADLKQRNARIANEPRPTTH